MRLKLVKLALLSALVACWLMVQPLALLTQAIAPKAGNAQTAAAVSPQTPEVPDADLLFRQGIAHYQANRFEAAIASWQSALEAYQQAQNLERVGAISNAIAAAHLKLSQYAAAATWAQQALTLAEAQNDVNAQAQSLGNLGIAYLEQGNYWQAIETYQRSLDLTPAALETPEAASETEAHLLGLLSNAYSALGDYDRAIALQTRSLEMAQSLGNSALEATALGNLGALHTTVGNYSTAIEYYQSGLRLAESIHDSTGIAYTLKNLGVAYHALNNVPQAIGYYQQSLIIARSLSQPQLEAAALTNLGIAYEDLGDYRQAIALHGESLAIARLSSDPQMVAQSLNNLGHAQLGANQLAEAAATLQQAIEILDRLRQHLSDLYTVSIFDTQVYTYNLLQQVLVAQADYARALEIAEQGRTRALVSLVANQQSAVITVSVADIQALAREQQTTLVEYSAVPDDAFKFQGKQRGRISELFIWVIQPTGEISFRRQAISLEQPLESLIAQSRSQIGGRGIFRSIRVAPAQVTETGNPLQTLYEILIAPIQDLLPAAATDPVILIPHENLFLVPFAALQAADETYLIEHHTLAIAPSIQLLGLTQTDPTVTLSATSQALVVGNPAMPSLALSPGEIPQILPPLPGAEQEAAAIAQLFHTAALTGVQATETAIAAQMPQAALIHLATHGLLDLDLPSTEPNRLHIPGAIALTPSATADGWLTAAEIAALHLHAELVVLSACDTGLGEITGDGVLGLARSLLGAGAKSTVVSLWAVPDAPTAELMIAFYQQLLQGSNKAQALRRAMLKTKASYPAPGAWAAFVLIGNSN